ncbi:DUF4279 domain-containing protein [Candidatus Albibeggiatoa sp. nov. NOAA]|uniref:DUF4279 domain-containing protein n=1 Tax=Candidatus Albibeggiatoa sp. nov. NOAA TaxID=3162724 RepID=UPI0032F2B827|nr:DUF4279 domain-containing protein [Thiotrichaceae bacterium]
MASPPLTNREYAYFRIIGQGDHSIISKKLNISSTNEWSAGDINPRTKRAYKFTSWQLESGLDDTHSIDEHFEKLFSILQPLEAELNELSASYDLYLQCVGYFPPSGHGIHLDKAIIQKAAKLGLSIDMDFYYVDDHGHDLDYH